MIKVEIVKDEHVKGVRWLKDWGLSTIRRAIYTVRNRKSSTNVSKWKGEI